jgi:hypothetical protein
MPTLDEDFSGEVSLVGKYELPEEPRPGERYRIALCDFSVSACVTVGGEEFTLGMSPMAVTIDGRLLKRRGEITVTVANTAANEIIAKRSVIESFPPAEVGVYAKKMYAFEERRAPLKIGKISIIKMK